MTDEEVSSSEDRPFVCDVLGSNVGTPSSTPSSSSLPSPSPSLHLSEQEREVHCFLFSDIFVVTIPKEKEKEKYEWVDFVDVWCSFLKLPVLEGKKEEKEGKRRRRKKEKEKDYGRRMYGENIEKLTRNRCQTKYLPIC